MKISIITRITPVQIRVFPLHQTQRWKTSHPVQIQHKTWQVGSKSQVSNKNTGNTNCSLCESGNEINVHDSLNTILTSVPWKVAFKAQYLGQESVNCPHTFPALLLPRLWCFSLQAFDRALNLMTWRDPAPCSLPHMKYIVNFRFQLKQIPNWKLADYDCHYTDCCITYLVERSQ